MLQDAEVMPLHVEAVPLHAEVMPLHAEVMLLQIKDLCICIILSNFASSKVKSLKI